jgi:hypothetical protein
LAVGLDAVRRRDAAREDHLHAVAYDDGAGLRADHAQVGEGEDGRPGGAGAGIDLGGRVDHRHAAGAGARGQVEQGHIGDGDPAELTARAGRLQQEAAIAHDDRKFCSDQLRA